LYPLTKFRAKPAVPIAGKYRLIDIPLSNCLNSGLDRIYVATQFNSASLHHHMQSYSFDHFSRGFVEILAAQQTEGNMNWYQGTADAVRQNFRYIQQRNVKYVLILSGDQLYRMDFDKMMRTHLEAEADVTISAVPVASKDAGGLGIMRLEDDGRVCGFLEKPKTEEELSHVRTDPAWIDERGIESRGRDCLANMGIYLFNRETLLEALEKTDYQDFGKEVFPASIRTKHVQVHLFDGYWEDIGTIRSFFEANLNLAAREPRFAISLPESPTFTNPRFLPPSRIDGAQISGSLIADGCIIEDGVVIENSIIGVRCHIRRGAVIRRSIVMGNDYYPSEAEQEADSVAGFPEMGIGAESVVEEAIVDKNCRVGERVRITNPNGVQDTNEMDFGMIRDGVICIPKETTLHNEWSLEETLK
jgi:glucose-1-phosphate adenylyltransferase